jgi:hypothetical protein
MQACFMSLLSPFSSDILAHSTHLWKFCLQGEQQTSSYQVVPDSSNDQDLAGGNGERCCMRHLTMYIVIVL